MMPTNAKAWHSICCILYGLACEIASNSQSKRAAPSKQNPVISTLESLVKDIQIPLSKLDKRLAVHVVHVPVPRRFNLMKMGSDLWLATELLLAGRVERGS